MKCIIKYRDEKEQDCFCGQLKECSNCNNGKFRKENECEKEIGGYCTCRTCGHAIRSNVK